MNRLKDLKKLIITELTVYLTPLIGTFSLKLWHL